MAGLTVMFCTRPRHYSVLALSLKRSLSPKSQFIWINDHFYSSRFRQCSAHDSLYWLHNTMNTLSLVTTYCDKVTKTCSQLCSDVKMDSVRNELSKPKVKTIKKRQRAGEVNTSVKINCSSPSATKSPRARRSKKILVEKTDSSFDSPPVKKRSPNKKESKVEKKRVTLDVSKSLKGRTKEKLSYTPLLPLFPFEGQPSGIASYSPLDDEFGSYSENVDYDIKRVDSSHGRFYHISSSKESFCFPSVTTVLDATMPKAMFYRLQNWKKSMVKEHGRTEFKKISANTLQSGTKFHKQLESRLLAGADREVITIKPWKHPQSHKEVYKDHGVQSDTNILIPKQHSKTLAHTQDEEPAIDHHIRQGTLPSDLLPLAELDDDISQVKTVHVSVNTPPTAQSEMELQTTIGNLAILKPGSSTLSDFHSKSKLNEVTTISEHKEKVDRSGVNAGIELEMSVPDRRNMGYMHSVEHILKDISCVCALESVVTHFELGYTGTFDCLAEYKGELCVIDWKTSTKPRPLLSDCFLFPLQAAAYAGAINQDFHYPFKVKSALIVIAYANGDPAHAHFLSHDLIGIYWEQWVERLEEYQTQFASDLSELVI